MIPSESCLGIQALVQPLPKLTLGLGHVTYQGQMGQQKHEQVLPCWGMPP